MVYFILVEARNCVEFSIFPRLWPSLCILFWWRPEIVSNSVFFLGCGRVCVLFWWRPEIVSNYLFSVVAEFVYFILVEARNCVELSVLGCGRAKIFKLSFVLAC